MVPHAILKVRLDGYRDIFFSFVFLNRFFSLPDRFWDGFGRPKPLPKSIFSGFFFGCVFLILFYYFLLIFGVFFRGFSVVFKRVFVCIIAIFLLCAFFENVDFVLVFTVFRGCWLSLVKMF